MGSFDDFFNAVLDGSKGLATDALTGLVDKVRSDAKAFLQDSKKDLKDWTEALANNELSQMEFETLVRGQIDLTKMKALTDAGIAGARINKLKDDLINLVVGKAIDIFL